MKTKILALTSIFLLTAIGYSNESIRMHAKEFIRTVETEDLGVVYESLHPKSKSEFENLIHELKTKRPDRIDGHILFHMPGIRNKEQFIESSPKDIWKSLASDWSIYIKEFGEEVTAVSELTNGGAYVVTTNHHEKPHIMTDCLVNTYFFLPDGEKWKPVIPEDTFNFIYPYFFD